MATVTPFLRTSNRVRIRQDSLFLASWDLQPMTTAEMAAKILSCNKWPHELWTISLMNNVTNYSNDIQWL